MRRIVVGLTLSILVLLHAQADSWPRAQIQARASGNGMHVVRIVPGTSMGDVVGFSGLPKGPYAVAEWYLHSGSSYQKVRETRLLNPVSPVQIEVTNAGTLVAIDNWHNLGKGVVLAIYSAKGIPVKSFTLTDLYAPARLERIQSSVSSTHWRCAGLSVNLEPNDMLWVDDSLGGRFMFNINTGTFEYQDTGGTCK
jgi:hypothetical protein